MQPILPKLLEVKHKLTEFSVECLVLVITISGRNITGAQGRDKLLTPCVMHVEVQHNFRDGIVRVMKVEVKNLRKPLRGALSAHSCQIKIYQVDGYLNKLGNERLRWKRTFRSLEQGRSCRWTEALTLRSISNAKAYCAKIKINQRDVTPFFYSVLRYLLEP